MDETKPRRIAGIEVAAEELTPLEVRLLQVFKEQQAEIQALRDELARVKRLPRRPNIRRSTLNAPCPDPARKPKKRCPSGKRA